MRLLALIAVLVLAGCTTAPVKRNFPEVPADLKQACPDLRLTDNTDKLSEVMKVVVDNYGQYHECRIKTDAWIEWYNSQKQIFDSVK